MISVIGCGMLVSSYISITTWQISASRQSQTIRVVLFRSILRQEMGWFDTQEIGELNTRLAELVEFKKIIEVCY